MARGFSRNARGARATFREAGGTRVYATHPKLIGQLQDTTYGAGTILVSSSVELDSEFMTIRPMVDASRMKLTVSGDTVIITNNVSAGTIDLRMLETTGEVSTGDPVACFNAIRDTGDTQGWIFEIHSFINGLKHITKLTGCALVSLPRKIVAGNDVPTYDATFNYTNLIEMSGEAQDSTEEVWLTGNTQGVSGTYTPFDDTVNATTEPGTASSQYINANVNAGSDIISNGFTVEQIADAFSAPNGKGLSGGEIVSH